MGWSTVCDCGIFWSYSLTFWVGPRKMRTFSRGFNFRVAHIIDPRYLALGTIPTNISSLMLLSTRWSKYDFWIESQESKSRLGVCAQVRYKAAYPATETSHNLETLAEANLDIIFSIQQTRKVQIKLRLSAVWSAPVLFALNKTYFSRRGEFVPRIFGHCMEGV